MVEKPALYERFGCMWCSAMNEAMGLRTRVDCIKYFDYGEIPKSMKDPKKQQIALKRGAWVKENVCPPGCLGDARDLTPDQQIELDKIGLI